MKPQLSLLERFGKAEEIAHANLWLASDQSSGYDTGTTIHADADYVWTLDLDQPIGHSSKGEG